MRKYSSFAISLGVAYCLLIAGAATAFACSANPLSPDQLLTKSDVIVRATAIGYKKMPDQRYRTTGVPESLIEFRVEEVLKGGEVPPTLVINGYLSDQDDFNDRPVPYGFVRRSGRRGSCYANDYKEGAEFLLFLKKNEAALTPYWAALTPTNEQLHAADDAWLAWVRGHLKPTEKRDVEQVGVFKVFLPSMSCWLGCPPKGAI